MRRMPAVLTPILALFLCTALPAAGQGIIGTSITANSIEVSVSLPGGIGADVGISFEQVSGLSLANLGLSVQLANLLDPAFRARLPNLVLPALPLLLRIEPPAAGSLSFSGVTEIGIHTHNLGFVPGTPLRFFSAPVGGKFEDVTAAMGAGSYRARATKGGFSDFLIVADLRPRSHIITAKFNRLEELLEQYEGSMTSGVYDDLEDLLDDARSAHAGGSSTAAIAKIDAFIAVVEQHSGTEIPDVWRSARDVQNVAGYLRGAALTLRFTLGLKGGLLGF